MFYAIGYLKPRNLKFNWHFQSPIIIGDSLIWFYNILHTHTVRYHGTRNLVNYHSVKSVGSIYII